MTQSFTLREPDSDLAQAAVFTSSNMMPPWKKQSDVAFNLLQGDPGVVMLEKPGQKRRRSFMPTCPDQLNLYNDNTNLPHGRVSYDSVQLSGVEPYPASTGGNMFGTTGLDSAQSFPSERRGFYSRILESSSCGIFPFRAPEVVEHGGVDPRTAHNNSSVFLQDGRNNNNNVDASGAHNQYNYRNHHRTLDPAAAATAQAMASFQALIDQSRSSSTSGFQAYNNHGSSTGPLTSTLPNPNPVPPQHRQFTPPGAQQQLHSNYGLSNSSFGVVPTSTSSTGFNYFNVGSSGNNQSGFLEDINSSAFGDADPTGIDGIYGASPETTWPNLACQTSTVPRNVSQSTIPLAVDPPTSPCTPRGHHHRRSITTVLSDSQEEYLQHLERINSEALMSADTPHHSSRGRRLSSFDPPSSPADRNATSVFHPFELANLGYSNPQQQPAKHLHVYFDESGVPQRVDVEDSARVGVEDSSAHVGVEDSTYATTTTQVDESAGGPCGAPGEETQEEKFSESFEPAAAMAGEKDNRRNNNNNNNNNNTADQFDLNEVPVGVGEATPPKPRKKYHPRVAKDKRTYKRRVDGKKVPASPADGFTHMDSPAKRSEKKRSNQYDSIHEGRESSYPEVVDMDIEDAVGVTPLTATQHDTAVCDCEACIKLRLERRNSIAAGHNSTEPRFTCLDDDMPQSPVSLPELRHSRASDPWGTSAPDSPSDSPSVRRTLFQQASAPPAPREPELDQASIRSTSRLSLAFDDSSPDTLQLSNTMVLTQSNATAYANVRAFFSSHRAQSSCLQQFNESTTQLGLGWNGRQQQVHGFQSEGAAIVAAKPAFDWNPAPFHRPAATNPTFMSRLCPRGILSPQNIPFRNMNAIQRVVYLKSILNSNHQLTMSPESLLRHVYDHLPEDEKEQFRFSLWPIILKPLTDEQMKQLEDYASAEPVVGASSMAMAVVKRKPGPKPKNKPSKKELAMTPWPDLVTQDGSHKPAKGEKPGRKSKIKCSVVVSPSGVVDAQNGLEMVPYETHHDTQSMVPYENKSVVPYEGPFNPLRKRKPRPKVVLDNETVRVWKLLMGKTTSTSAENVTDAENELKWVEERRKMKAQALLFIERMHIVQGDRSFSCWKGSVVDSVVGAFLTQNVNDVLSSSAFMSMRSRFPGRGFRRPTKGDLPEEETVAQSCESLSSPAPSPLIHNPQTNDDAQLQHNPSPTDAPEFPPTSSVTVLESQESRNEGENYHMQQPAATAQEPPIPCQTHEESASTLSEVTNQQPEDVVLSQSGLSEQSQTTAPANAQSENSSSGLEYQTVPEESSSARANNGVANSHPVDLAVDPVSTEGSVAALTVEGNGHEPSHGKFNPKTGLTGLERAKIEEKQVTARKSFDFSGLQEEFKPRLAGEQRLPAPPRTELTEDGVDWEAVRSANVQEVADVIKERGLNWILAGRIKAFLERIHLDYGTLDLEWLRSMSTDQTKEFLLSIRGLGLKSVECIRLLTLHHLAFPVDTNVGRICVRLGWVPLEPLPEELQLHLLELYPVQATIQKYLWPRLCKLDQQTLYELHYQMITFGKVFCTKSKPNCNACPMRPECKHFASALSSAKLALPAPERPNNGPTLALPPGTTTTPMTIPHDRVPEPPRPVSQYCQPIVEEPMTPESEADMEEYDIEDYPFTVEEVDDDTDMSLCIQNGGIQDQPSAAHPPHAPTQLVHQSHSIDNPNCSSILNVTISEPDPVSEPLPEVVSEPVVSESATIMEDWGGLATSTTTGAAGSEEGCSKSVIDVTVESVCEEVGDVESNVGNASEVLIHPSHEMVLVAPGAASLPVPQLKNVGRLRTVHYVYELPDNHPLLDGLDRREEDDPCTYLLAIWSPGEVPESIPNMNDTVDEENPFASSNCEGEESIKATLLVPCRTAMQGSFPLNGTYFQVNEVFADHASSLQPMIVPRTLLWNLRRRFVFFGTSVTSIFRGMTVEEIQACFWRGYVCVRGFDRATRAPKPLVGRLHLQAGKGGKGAIE